MVIQFVTINVLTVIVGLHLKGNTMNFLKTIFDFYVAYFSSSFGKFSLLLLGLALIPLALEILIAISEFLKKKKDKDKDKKA